MNILNRKDENIILTLEAIAMTVNDLSKELKDLQEQGKGEYEVVDLRNYFKSEIILDDALSLIIFDSGLI